ncbi:MAG: hypothetical protein ACM3IL_02595, partial [Deltaproteobacteria bacterium]
MDHVTDYLTSENSRLITGSTLNDLFKGLSLKSKDIVFVMSMREDYSNVLQQVMQFARGQGSDIEIVAMNGREANRYLNNNDANPERMTQGEAKAYLMTKPADNNKSRIFIIDPSNATGFDLERNASSGERGIAFVHMFDQRTDLTEADQNFRRSREGVYNDRAEIEKVILMKGGQDYDSTLKTFGKNQDRAEAQALYRSIKDSLAIGVVNDLRNMEAISTTDAGRSAVRKTLEKFQSEFSINDTLYPTEDSTIELTLRSDIQHMQKLFKDVLMAEKGSFDTEARKIANEIIKTNAPLKLQDRVRNEGKQLSEVLPRLGFNEQILEINRFFSKADFSKDVSGGRISETAVAYELAPKAFAQEGGFRAKRFIQQNEGLRRQVAEEIADGNGIRGSPTAMDILGNYSSRPPSLISRLPILSSRQENRTQAYWQALDFITDPKAGGLAIGQQISASSPLAAPGLNAQYSDFDWLKAVQGYRNDKFSEGSKQAKQQEKIFLNYFGLTPQLLDTYLTAYQAMENFNADFNANSVSAKNLHTTLAQGFDYFPMLVLNNLPAEKKSSVENAVRSIDRIGASTFTFEDTLRVEQQYGITKPQTLSLYNIGMFSSYGYAYLKNLHKIIQHQIELTNMDLGLSEENFRMLKEESDFKKIEQSGEKFTQLLNSRFSDDVEMLTDNLRTLNPTLVNYFGISGYFDNLEKSRLFHNISQRADSLPAVRSIAKEISTQSTKKLAEIPLSRMYTNSIDDSARRALFGLTISRPLDLQEFREKDAFAQDHLRYLASELSQKKADKFTLAAIFDANESAKWFKSNLSRFGSLRQERSDFKQLAKQSVTVNALEATKGAKTSELLGLRGARADNYRDNLNNYRATQAWDRNEVEVFGKIVPIGIYDLGSSVWAQRNEYLLDKEKRMPIVMIEAVKDAFKDAYNEEKGTWNVQKINEIRLANPELNQLFTYAFRDGKWNDFRILQKITSEPAIAKYAIGLLRSRLDTFETEKLRTAIVRQKIEDISFGRELDQEEISHIAEDISKGNISEWRDLNGVIGKSEVDALRSGLKNMAKPADLKTEADKYVKDIIASELNEESIIDAAKGMVSGLDKLSAETKNIRNNIIKDLMPKIYSSQSTFRDEFNALVNRDFNLVLGRDMVRKGGAWAEIGKNGEKYNVKLQGAAVFSREGTYESRLVAFELPHEFSHAAFDIISNSTYIKPEIIQKIQDAYRQNPGNPSLTISDTLKNNYMTEDTFKQILNLHGLDQASIESGLIEGSLDDNFVNQRFLSELKAKWDIALGEGAYAKIVDANSGLSKLELGSFNTLNELAGTIYGLKYMIRHSETYNPKQEYGLRFVYENLTGHSELGYVDSMRKMDYGQLKQEIERYRKDLDLGELNLSQDYKVNQAKRIFDIQNTLKANGKTVLFMSAAELDKATNGEGVFGAHIIGDTSEMDHGKTIRIIDKIALDNNNYIVTIAHEAEHSLLHDKQSQDATFTQKQLKELRSVIKGLKPYERAVFLKLETRFKGEGANAYSHPLIDLYRRIQNGTLDINNIAEYLDKTKGRLMTSREFQYLERPQVQKIVDYIEKLETKYGTRTAINKDGVLRDLRSLLKISVPKTDFAMLLELTGHVSSFHYAPLEAQAFHKADRDLLSFVDIVNRNPKLLKFFNDFQISIGMPSIAANASSPVSSPTVTMPKMTTQLGTELNASSPMKAIPEITAYDINGAEKAINKIAEINSSSNFANTAAIVNFAQPMADTVNRWVARQPRPDIELGINWDDSVLMRHSSYDPWRTVSEIRGIDTIDSLLKEKVVGNLTMRDLALGQYSKLFRNEPVGFYSSLKTSLQNIVAQ